MTDGSRGMTGSASLWHAPFTDSQIEALWWWQTSSLFHEYTCGGDGCREQLVPTADGWICPKCDYTQDWAHEFEKPRDWENYVDENGWG